MFAYYDDRHENDVYMFTDLAVERRRADTAIPGVSYERKKCSCGAVERVKISTKEAVVAVGKPIGTYITLNTERMDDLETEEIEEASDELARLIVELCDENHIIPGRILAVGLGNSDLTPDSIGPKCAEKIIATLHIMKHEAMRFENLECSEIAVISPGVCAKSGIVAEDYVAGIAKRINPDAIFVFDALASRSPARLGRTIQISDNGICPGSGVGNSKGEISACTVGAPVISIGVPTVMDSRHFTKDGYLTGEPMFVSPREIDGIVENAARIIGGAVNQAFGVY